MRKNKELMAEAARQHLARQKERVQEEKKEPASGAVAPVPEAKDRPRTSNYPNRESKTSGVSDDQAALIVILVGGFGSIALVMLVALLISYQGSWQQKQINYEYQSQEERSYQKKKAEERQKAKDFVYEKLRDSGVESDEASKSAEIIIQMHERDMKLRTEKP
ncbi:hypothetical protein [Bremerella sp. P1]|uniref:hypothetical protein n=1 Tax=Bremerella sp. P1 TaxID=3026424 RepID=UPI0023676C8E|nr:hypothetical protein [Bremerella sp. P1]WDI42095.1 hypothetical protein PSR63_26945 [Bremerella sp. P1]